MSTTRSDGWIDAEDYFLAQTILRHIREGSTQLNAFDEVGDVLQRTADACGFRWNSNVRKQYAMQISKAKLVRKERNNKRLQPARSAKIDQISGESIDEISMSSVFTFLNNMHNAQLHAESRVRHLKNDLIVADLALNELGQERLRLMNTLQQDETISTTLMDDYQVLLTMMEHAARLMEQDQHKHISREKIG